MTDNKFETFGGILADLQSSFENTLVVAKVQREFEEEAIGFYRRIIAQEAEIEELRRCADKELEKALDEIRDIIDPTQHELLSEELRAKHHSVLVTSIEDAHEALAKQRAEEGFIEGQKLAERAAEVEKAMDIARLQKSVNRKAKAKQFKDATETLVELSKLDPKLAKRMATEVQKQVDEYKASLARMREQNLIAVEKAMKGDIVHKLVHGAGELPGVINVASDLYHANNKKAPSAQEWRTEAKERVVAIAMQEIPNLAPAATGWDKLMDDLLREAELLKKKEQEAFEAKQAKGDTTGDATNESVEDAATDSQD